MSKHIQIISGRRKIIDDFKGFLDGMGYKTTSCLNGKSAILSSFSKAPDLILCDHRLDDVSGDKLARQFKTDPSLREIPFIILNRKTKHTLAGLEPDTDPAADEVIRMPISQPALYGLITRWLENGGSKGVAPFQKDPTPVPDPAQTSFLRGRITCYTISRLLYHLLAQKKTGVLSINRDRWMKIVVDNGSIVDVNSNFIPEDTLGKYLIERHKITDKENQATVRKARQRCLPQGQVLIHHNLVEAKELDQFVTQHKMQKFLRLFDARWKHGTYHFVPKRITTPKYSMDSVPISHLLQAGIHDVATAEDLHENFLRHNKQDAPIMLDRRFEQVANILDFQPQSIELTHSLEGKSIEQIRKSHPNQFDTMIGLAFLLIVTRGAKFAPRIHMPKIQKATAESLVNEVVHPKGPPVVSALSSPSIAIPSVSESLQKGTALFNMESYSEAVPYLEVAVSAKPDDSNLLSMLGYSIYNRESRTDPVAVLESVMLLKKAVRKDPYNDTALYRLGHTYKLEKSDLKACKYFRQAININPNNIDAQRELTLLKIKDRTKSQYNSSLRRESPAYLI